MDFYFGRLSGNSTRSAFALCEAGVPTRPIPSGPRTAKIARPLTWR